MASQQTSVRTEIDYTKLKATREFVLDRMALVDPEIATVHELEAAIRYADTLQLLDLDNVQPIFTVLEGEHVFCPMHDDKVEQDCTRKDIFANAAKVEEDYFVAPSPAFVSRRRDARNDAALHVPDPIIQTTPRHHAFLDDNLSQTKDPP